ncbi:MAG: hypothetical protein GY862_18905 [Gammaproteobacteria bacterium]|nr:hypothetical protein [Gammaproteobacteria bacterium]
MLKDTIENMRHLAQTHGGQCLSAEYINNETKLRWQCQAGHQWEAVPNSIKRGTWCPVCSHCRKLTMEQVQAIARQQGGRCLSKEYINGRSRMLWECSEGHQWQATTSSIKGGTWCAACRKTKKKTIEEMQELARQQGGGQCLSTSYINSNTALRWRCEHGHEWETAPVNVIRGGWCPICRGVYKQQSVSKWQIEDMCSIAKERGGRCLSKKYRNVRSKLLWQCANGHQWNAMPTSILSGSWCPACLGRGKTKTIDDMQAVAKTYGGQCLSDAYVNEQTKLLWECSEGHQWRAKPQYILFNETWCPVCAGKNVYENNQLKPRWDIEKMQQTAQSRGGECLSKQYGNIKTKLRWRCQAQHEWEATPFQILRGGWCPICQSESQKKYSLDSMRKLAQAHGGELLSQKYVNKYASNLIWRCEAGHQWSAPPARILSGHWCPACVKNHKKNIEDMQQAAKARNGECLSEKYVNSRTPLRWRCHKGHEWEAKPRNISNNHWCPMCSKSRKKTIEEMRKLAKSRGGLCLSETYVNVFTKLRWQCFKGHEWETRPSSVIQGTWCPHCYQETCRRRK